MALVPNCRVRQSKPAIPGSSCNIRAKTSLKKKKRKKKRKKKKEEEKKGVKTSLAPFHSTFDLGRNEDPRNSKVER